LTSRFLLRTRRGRCGRVAVLARRHDGSSEDFRDDGESERVRGEEGDLREESDEVDEEGEIGSREKAKDDLSGSDSTGKRV
jgi:hypothetical protein